MHKHQSHTFQIENPPHTLEGNCLPEVLDLDQLLEQVRNHQLAILSDGQGGLWPAARSR